MRAARCPSLLSVLLLAATALPAQSGGKGRPFEVAAGDVTDRRRNDGFFSELEVEVKLSGAGLAELKGARVLVSKAVDDTGRDLLGSVGKPPDFEEAAPDRPPKLAVKLKNPPRRAKVIKELSGRVEAFLPGRDRASVVRLEKFLSRVGTPISSPTLKAAQAEVVVLSREAYEAAKRKEDERRKKEAESAGALGAMAEAFGGLFSGLMGQVEENDLVIQTKDPNKKLFGFEVTDGSGKAIERQGGMSTTDFRILKFGQKLPADAVLTIYVQTAKSLATVPFTLKDVSLP